MKVAFVLGTSTGGTARHVRMLAAGCAARGVAVEVFGPRRPTATSRSAPWPAARSRSRRWRSRTGRAPPATCGRSGGCAGCSPPGGPMWCTRTACGPARSPRSRWRSSGPPSTTRGPRWSSPCTTRPPAGGVTGAVYRVLELIVARSADSVLCVSPDLEERMRAAGARRVGRGPWSRRPAFPRNASRRFPCRVTRTRPARGAGGGPAGGAERVRHPAGGGRRVAGPAARAAPGHRGRRPARGRPEGQAARLGLDARFPGHRDDVPALLAAAAVFVLPSCGKASRSSCRRRCAPGCPSWPPGSAGSPADRRRRACSSRPETPGAGRRGPRGADRRGAGRPAAQGRRRPRPRLAERRRRRDRRPSSSPAPSPDPAATP